LRLYEKYEDEHLGYVREAVDLLLSCPKVGLTWDIGHDHAAGGVDCGFIRDGGFGVRRMRLHDALGEAPRPRSAAWTVDGRHGRILVTRRAA
jgi:hypothetical protein